MSAATSARSSTGGDRRQDGDRLPSSRLHAGDLLRVGSVGLLSRRLRAALSALGISIGIAAVVGVLGISESSRADLIEQLDRLGTNLLTVQAGTGLGGGGDAALPRTATAMLGRVAPVESVSSVTAVDAAVLRSDVVPEDRTGGVSVLAADVDLLDTLGAGLADGVWLDEVSSELPVVVLGAVAAERLGVDDVGDGTAVWLGERWFTVVGVLEPVELAQDVDRAALVGLGVAASELGAEENPSTIYVRADPESVEQVRDVVPATTDPEDPDQVEVSRPSDALEARAAASSAYTNLFLGLGAVALLVGGVGIANVMVISVLERRSEIGLRRALGATRRHVAVQFLAEALLLSLVGGIAGVALGAAATAGYALLQGWQVVVPLVGVLGGLGAALLIGAVAGLYPAVRASRMSPTEALRTV